MDKNAIFENIKLQFKNINSQLEQNVNLESANSCFQIYNISFQMLNLVMQMMNFGKFLPYEENNLILQQQIINCGMQIQNLSTLINNMNNKGVQINNIVQPQNMTNILLQNEFRDCNQDQFLTHIGSKFELENNDLFNWKVIMQGPIGTPYENGFFTLKIKFSSDFPKRGPEIKFVNKIYHLNIGNSNNEEEMNCGKICHPNLNEWFTIGKVKNYSNYNIREAIYDIYDLLCKPNYTCPHYDDMAELYKNDKQKFDEEVKKYVKKYATEPTTPFKKRNELFWY